MVCMDVDPRDSTCRQCCEVLDVTGEVDVNALERMMFDLCDATYLEYFDAWG